MPSAPTSYPGPGRRIPLVVGLVFMSTFFVILKIYARFKTKVAFGADDYLVYVCVLLNIPYMVLSIWSGIKGNNGTSDLTSLPLQDVTILLKSITIFAVLYIIIITLAKFSVLSLYRRIFGKSVMLGTSIIFVCQTIWAIVGVCFALFRCKPIAGSWDLALPSKCLSFEKIVIAAESFNAALDFAMIALPIRVIKKVQLPRRQKVSISAIFLLGSFVGIMAILRIVYTVRGNVDSSGQRVNAQINVGIVCACLPTLKPIFPKNTAVTTAVRDIVFSIRSRLRSTRPSQFSKDKATNGGINNASLVNREDRYKKMSGDAIDKAFLTEVTNGKELFGPNGDYPMDHIRVRDEVEVV